MTFTTIWHTLAIYAGLWCVLIPCSASRLPDEYPAAGLVVYVAVTLGAAIESRRGHDLAVSFLRHPLVPRHDPVRGFYLRCELCDPVAARSTSLIPPGDVERGTPGSIARGSDAAQHVRGAPTGARTPGRSGRPTLTEQRP